MRTKDKQRIEDNFRKDIRVPELPVRPSDNRAINDLRILNTQPLFGEFNHNAMGATLRVTEQAADI